MLRSRILRLRCMPLLLVLVVSGVGTGSAAEVVAAGLVGCLDLAYRARQVAVRAAGLPGQPAAHRGRS